MRVQVEIEDSATRVGINIHEKLNNSNFTTNFILNFL